MIHVAMHQEGAKVLRESLEATGRNDVAIGCPEILAMGPINPPSTCERLAWLRRELRWPEDELINYGKVIDTFWRQLDDVSEPLALWVTDVLPNEYSNFLECLQRLEGRPCHWVSLGDLELPSTDKHGKAWKIWPVILPFLKPHQLSPLFECLTSLDDVTRAAHLDRWREFQRENAPLRVVVDGEMRSAGIDYLDDYILAELSDDWRPTNSVIAYAMIPGRQWRSDRRWPSYFGDHFFHGRILALIDEGAIEYHGDPLDIRASEIRLRR